MIFSTINNFLTGAKAIEKSKVKDFDLLVLHCTSPGKLTSSERSTSLICRFQTLTPSWDTPIRGFLNQNS